MQTRSKLFLLSMTILVISQCANPQIGNRVNNKELSKGDHGWLRNVLHVTEEDIKKNYYDPKLHGFNIDARFDQAATKIDSAPNLNYAVSDIAGAVTDLNDSHTFFYPPPRPYYHEYGWRMEAEGDSDCFIVAVRPGSDAEKKGVKPGDQILTINGFSAIREDVWKLDYVFRTLRPQLSLKLDLRSPDGTIRQVETKAEFRPNKITGWLDWNENDFDREMREHRPRVIEFGKKVIFYKLSDFVFDPDSANGMLDQIRSHDALVLDLRGNPGGIVDFEEHFLGGMFDHEVKIGDRVGRKPMKALFTKSRGRKTFDGKLIVLIDSRSASAAELFARVMQLEHRGVVVGDRSSGKVMESIIHPHQAETFGGAFDYAVSISEANIIMQDGKSLENVGVMPDYRIVPTPADLAAGRDPALAYAANQVGVMLTPEEAGKLFPFIWPTEN